MDDLMHRFPASFFFVNCLQWQTRTPLRLALNSATSLMITRSHLQPTFYKLRRVNITLSSAGFWKDLCISSFNSIWRSSQNNNEQFTKVAPANEWLLGCVTRLHLPGKWHTAECHWGIFTPTCFSAVCHHHVCGTQLRTRGNSSAKGPLYFGQLGTAWSTMRYSAICPKCAWLLLLFPVLLKSLHAAPDAVGVNGVDYGWNVVQPEYIHFFSKQMAPPVLILKATLSHVHIARWLND